MIFKNKILHRIFKTLPLFRDYSSTAIHLKALKAAANAVMITDITGRIQWVNDSFLNLTGYTNDEALGKNISMLVKSGEHDEQFYKDLWSTILSGRIWKGIITNRKKNGTLYMEEQTITPVIGGNDEIVNFISIKEDITEKIKIEEALKDSEKRWQFAIEGAGDGLWDWDVKTGKVFFSKQWKAMLGFGDEEIGDTIDEWEKRVHPDDIKKCYEDLERHFNGDTDAYFNEHRVLCKDGSYKWILDRGIVVTWSSDDKPLRVIGTHSDISYRKETESIIRKLEKRLKLFFQQSLDGFFFMMLDEPVKWDEFADKESLLDYIFTHHKITHVNQAMANQFGGTIENFIGLTPADFYKHDLPDGRKIWKEFFDRGRLHIETQERKFDGTPIYIEGDYICLYEDDGRISGSFGIQRDITYRKNTEDAYRQKSEEMERFFTVALDLLSIADIDGHFIRVNRAWERTLGYSIDELERKNFLDFVHPDDIASTKQSLAALSDQIPVLNFTNRYLTRDGDYRFIEWRSYPSGKYIYSAARDVTDRINYEFELNKLAERLTLATGSAGIGIWDWIIADNELIWDHQMYKLYGIEEDKTANVYDSWRRTIYPEDREYIQSLFVEAVKKLSVFSANFRVISPDGNIHYLEGHALVIRDKNGKAVRITGVTRDISKSKKMEERLLTLSTTDSLTTAFNRRYLLHVIDSEISRAARYNAVFSLIMLDIDHFKNVNDTYGHDAGDEVLIVIVQTMQTKIRKNDVLARWGGEEFIILLSGTGLDNAKIFAEKLLSEVRSLVFEKSGKITASFGVTEHRLNETADSVLKRVDELVYIAKSEGRDCVRYA